ncbi:AraC-like ligand-binding domain-containing protein [Nocardioides luteus]|uniref:AraC-like ligand-binding domain-containing protein n=1 Tax=Nocardioides luteus TaxID=1844 RepID=UPI0018CAE14C|nr:helix-turn-helix domain-containing protein [Nocardioides luteus]MBG6099294.1 AraC-like DNA-binding protein [Nocardioides luteus]
MDTVRLDAELFAPRDREEAIRAIIWDSVVRVEIQQQPDPEQIRVHARIADLGALNICSVRANATTIERTSALAADPTDAYLFVGLQLSGTSIVVQGDHEAVLRPGDLAVYDTRRPYTLLNDHGIHQHYFRVPIGALALPGRALEAVTAVRLDGRRPLARATAGYLGHLADSVGDLSAAEAAQATAPTIGLIRTLLTAQLLESPLRREHLEDSLETRILEYIRVHLGDRDLSPRRIAAAHHISVRHLYRLMGRSGIVLGDWIRERRLERCRDELADPMGRTTIAEVAHTWGFSDPSQFGRAFKRVYAMTPREWMHISRAQSPD